MKRFKKILKWVGLIVLLLALTGGSLYMIYLRPFIVKMKEITMIPYDKELMIIIGGGGNSGIITSDSLVIVVDTKMDEAAKNLYDQAKQVAGNKPILVVNTHIHPDHTGGNKYYTHSTVIAGGNYTPEHWSSEAGKESLPNEWLKDRKDIIMNDDTISIINFGKPAHTESDVFVYSHKRRILFGGDVILNKQNAIIMDKADPDGYIEAMDYFLTSFPVEHIVPGHGAFGGKEVAVKFKQYFKDMKTAASDESQRDALLTKYKDWNGIPVFMSPKSTMKAFKNKL